MAGRQDYSEAILPLPEIAYPHLSANAIEERSPDLPILVKFLKDHDGLKVLLIVHAAGPEDAATLQRLTEERAIRLKRYVVSNGIDSDRVRTVAYGARYPVRACQQCGREDYRVNTRVEAKVIEW